MSRIRQLDAAVINKIAAGEVVERPASVVKELLENSVDALSSRIDVDIAQGGTELIRIADDGEGIEADDLPLALASHATSKLRDADDLFRVMTMGFRGEALASIGSVSELRIRSRTPEGETGYEIVCNQGEIRDPVPCGCPVGTVLEIRRLFANTPVRRRFMRTVGTEFGHIGEQFTRVALAHPRLQMMLRHNDRIVHELPGEERLIDRIRSLFGKNLAEKLLWVESESDGVRLSGYVAHPGENRSTRKGQHLFLNGRWIQDRSLQHALGEAYRGLLMVGRHPVAFLSFDLPPDLVDVNVHPTKTEVRFVDGQRLYRQLLSTLRTRFLSIDLDGTMSVRRGGDSDEDGGDSVASTTPDPARKLQLEAEFADWAKSSLATWTPNDEPAEGRVVEPTTLLTALATRDNQPEVKTANEADPSPFDDEATSVRASGTVETLEAAVKPAAMMDGRKVMQILDTYLVLESDEGLVVIDQHALHERVMYEYLRERVLGEGVESQRLLVPVVVEVTSRERELLFDHGDLLGSLGFELDDFGGGSLAITGYPAMLGKLDPEPIVRDLVERLDTPGKQPDRRDLLDEMLHMMSCKAAIKAGHRLSPEEMEMLLRKRHLVQDAHHCPHGRPTALVLSRDELDRQFGRLG